MFYTVSAPERSCSLVAQLVAGCLFFGLLPPCTTLLGGGSGQQAPAGGVATLPFCAAFGLYQLSDALFQDASRGLVFGWPLLFSSSPGFSLGFGSKSRTGS